MNNKLILKALVAIINLLIAIRTNKNDYLDVDFAENVSKQLKNDFFDKI